MPSRVASEIARATRCPDSIADSAARGSMGRHDNTAAACEDRPNKLKGGAHGEEEGEEEATKGSAKKSLKLRKKPLRDLPAKKTSTKVKGGADVSLSPSQLAALKSLQPKPPCRGRPSLPPTSRCNRACRLPARR